MTKRSSYNYVVSIGYQGKSVVGIVDALVSARVHTLLDVRAAAWSQRPQFRKTALADALKAAGIDYVHCKAAGNPFRPKQGESRDFRTCERLYSRHLEENPDIVDALALLVTDQPSALFCYEAHRAECHRGILLDHLTARRPELAVKDL